MIVTVFIIQIYLLVKYLFEDMVAAVNPPAHGKTPPGSRAADPFAHTTRVTDPASARIDPASARSSLEFPTLFTALIEHRNKTAMLDRRVAALERRVKGSGRKSSHSQPLAFPKIIASLNALEQRLLRLEDRQTKPDPANVYPLRIRPSRPRAANRFTTARTSAHAPHPAAHAPSPSSSRSQRRVEQGGTGGLRVTLQRGRQEQTSRRQARAGGVERIVVSAKTQRRCPADDVWAADEPSDNESEFGEEEERRSRNSEEESVSEEWSGSEEESESGEWRQSGDLYDECDVR